VSIRVLIVDDAMFMRSMIKDILTNSGKFEVIGEAANGQEAIDFFKTKQPDVITMDIVMPVMDGIEATKEILKINPSAKVVMVSALGQEPLVIESIAAGARDFIVKPFSPEKVLKVLEQVVKMS
jgi:two-component system, chemotaxis family, chemotaxis protein CheY